MNGSEYRSGHPELLEAVISFAPTDVNTPKTDKTASGNGAAPAIGTPQVSSSPSDYPPPRSLTDEDEFEWDENEAAVNRYRALGRRLAACGDLYRHPEHGGGLLLVIKQPIVESTVIDTCKKLDSVIVDRLRIRRRKDGKDKGCHLPAAEINTMLGSEAFLQGFRPLDSVTQVAQYLPDFRLPSPGYNDGGRGGRFLYVGPEVRVENSADTINSFLEVMPFSSNADRTNTVAAALTVALRYCWPGAKPVIVVTANKSHAGKDTIISFATGRCPAVPVSYDGTDWALQRSIVAALNHCPMTGVLVIENARLVRGSQQIASAFLERFITDPNPLLHSSATGSPRRFANRVVTAISTNFGTVSEDLMNRALPIHLAMVGNVADRVSAIGNPKLEFLPAHQGRIEAQLFGMIEKWKQAGRPLDATVRHPFTDWARTIGGILQVNGFTDFLANYSLRRTADDPVRRGLGLLGAARRAQWLSPDAWARLAVDMGLVKSVIPENDRENDKSRERGIGVVLSAHEKETFCVEDTDERLTLVLKKDRCRFEGGKISKRYCFDVLAREQVPEDAVQDIVRGGQDRDDSPDA